MGKLGKKARKFAKKNLQSVLRNRRKTKAFFKKRPSSKNEPDSVDNQVGNTSKFYNGRNTDGEDIVNTSLDAAFTEDDSDMVSDASDSDGFLSEDSSCPYSVESENEVNIEDISDASTLSMQNRKIYEELAMRKKILDKLKKKDPEFVKFLESYNKDAIFQNEDVYSDEDETSIRRMQLVDESDSATIKALLLTSPVINSWIQLVTEEHNESALISLLNAYRAACHLGTESTGFPDAASCRRIQNSDTFCNIFMFMLQEADNIFRGLLKIQSSDCKKETILELKRTPKWKKMKPLVKSYLRSTLFLLNQVTNSEILAFSLTRLRASIMFFAAFPSLLRRLIKIMVTFWATGGGNLSSCSFLIIRDVASLFSSNCFDTCLIKAYKAYIGCCRNLEIADVRHIDFLRNSFVGLCSLDVHKSCGKALISIQQLANILQRALRKEEAGKKICSWQYAKCIDIWVLFISANVHDHEIQPLFYMIIQLINGVANLFPAPRYFPLRVKCIQWLSKLSSSSGIFIPVASLVLDVLEYKTGWEGGKPGKAINFPSFLKLPKHYLKSQNFQEECVNSVIELLSVHFDKWSYHISFPDLATIPLIRLRKFHQITNIESLRRVVKRLIDQVEQNVEFVQKKRDEVAFSPKDQQSVELFLQLEKGSVNAPFTQYYRSVVEKAAANNLHMNEKISLLEPKKLKQKRRQLQANMVDGGVNSDSERSHASVNGKVDSKVMKRRALEV